jgi:Domain of unknown function (DUF5658)
MNDDPTGSQRGQADRRSRSTSPLDAFRLRGRRVRPRRSDERRGKFFTDRFDALTLAMVVTLLSLTVVDGMLTLELLELNSEEANPFMEHLLKRGPLDFVLGKYILTAFGLPFIVVYKNYPMFKTRFRIGFLLPVFISLYVALISYQCMLLHAGPTDLSTGSNASTLTAGLRSGVPLTKVLRNAQRRPTP